MKIEYEQGEVKLYSGLILVMFVSKIGEIGCS